MTESSLTEPRGGASGAGQPLQVLQQWHNGLRISHIAHSKAESFYRRRWRLMGVSVIVLSSLVGTTIFGSLQSSPDFRWRLAAGLLSLAAAVTSALQTFLGYAEVADRHRASARAYGAIRRRVDQWLISTSEGLGAAGLEEIRLAWDEADSAAPVLPQRLHDNAYRLVTGRKRQR